MTVIAKMVPTRPDLTNTADSETDNPPTTNTITAHSEPLNCNSKYLKVAKIPQEIFSESSHNEKSSPFNFFF